MKKNSIVKIGLLVLTVSVFTGCTGSKLSDWVPPGGYFKNSLKAAEYKRSPTAGENYYYQQSMKYYHW